VFISVAQLVSHPKTSLKLCAEAAHLLTTDHANRVELTRRVATPGPPGRRKLLPTIPSLIKNQWVKINLPTTLVSQYKARRKAWLARLVVFESAFRERLPSRVKVTQFESEVEV
jgi:hypothetical protein